MLCVWCEHGQSILCISPVLWFALEDHRKLYLSYTFPHGQSVHVKSCCIRKIFLPQIICSSCFLAPREVLCSIPNLSPLGWLRQSAAFRAIPNSIYLFLEKKNKTNLTKKTEKKRSIYFVGGCHNFSVFTLTFCPLPLEFAHGRELNSWVSTKKTLTKQTLNQINGDCALCIVPALIMHSPSLFSFSSSSLKETTYLIQILWRSSQPDELDSGINGE